MPSQALMQRIESLSEWFQVISRNDKTALARLTSDEPMSDVSYLLPEQLIDVLCSERRVDLLDYILTSSKWFESLTRERITVRIASDFRLAMWMCEIPNLEIFVQWALNTTPQFDQLLRTLESGNESDIALYANNPISLYYELVRVVTVYYKQGRPIDRFIGIIDDLIPTVGPTLDFPLLQADGTYTPFVGVGIENQYLMSGTSLVAMMNYYRLLSLVLNMDKRLDVIALYPPILHHYVMLRPNAIRNTAYITSLIKKPEHITILSHLHRWLRRPYRRYVIIIAAKCFIKQGHLRVDIVKKFGHLIILYRRIFTEWVPDEMFILSFYLTFTWLPDKVIFKYLRTAIRAIMADQKDFCFTNLIDQLQADCRHQLVIKVVEEITNNKSL